MTDCLEDFPTEAPLSGAEGDKDWARTVALFEANDLLSTLDVF